MNNKNVTELINCFVRAYHYKNNKYRIFDDSLASILLKEEEYNSISENIKIEFNLLKSDFKNNKKDFLKWIVNNKLSPYILGKAVFLEERLANSIMLGNRQCLIYKSEYNTYAYRNIKHLDKISVFEIDKKEVIEDKKNRLLNSNIDISKVNFIECDFTSNNLIQSVKKSKYNADKISFSSLLGISYFLTKEEFINLIKEISKIIKNGSSIVFDYINYDNIDISNIVGEIKSKYNYIEIEKILADNDLYIYEHLNDVEITNMYFDKYNSLNPDNKIYSPKNVNYCLAIKQSK